jgi:glutamate-ammonia-ligase adenylyltransferase
MLPGSDLDLMLIYDHPPEVSESLPGRTGRSLPASTWFLRAAHALIGAITAPGTEGPLYAVDMRLRPSGNKGPVAVSLASFIRYHATDAWTWERMALTRARVIAGDRGLRAKVRAAIDTALDHAGPAATILADAAAMRARLAAELPADGPWDVKARAGGLIEVEFIAQALQLVARSPARDPNTGRALARLARTGHLSPAEATTLIRADRFWRMIQGLVRLTVGGAQPPPPAARAPLAAELALPTTTALDAETLRANLDQVATDVRTIFTHRIGAV